MEKDKYDLLFENINSIEEVENKETENEVVEKIKNKILPNIKKEVELENDTTKIKEILVKNANTNNLIKGILRENVDYGIIPGTQIPSLYQSGAGVLKKAFGITIKYELTDKIFITDKGKEFFYVEYKAKAFLQNKFLDEAIASCNSKEPGKGGSNIFSKLNTITQIAQKRAMVRCIRILLGLTGLFTQDLEQNQSYLTKSQKLETYKYMYNCFKVLPKYKDLTPILFKEEVKKLILLPLFENGLSRNFNTWNAEDVNMIKNYTDKILSLEGNENEIIR